MQQHLNGLSLRPSFLKLAKDRSSEPAACSGTAPPPFQTQNHIGFVESAATEVDSSSPFHYSPLSPDGGQPTLDTVRWNLAPRRQPELEAHYLSIQRMWMLQGSSPNADRYQMNEPATWHSSELAAVGPRLAVPPLPSPNVEFANPATVHQSFALPISFHPLEGQLALSKR
ncbi:hypothetical protein BU15DRAFT_79451 [Melanogaster broomeanus]|nr:hypothetical protein BU15DRAFT_79451 [Melanogaster broomeanus]